MGYTHQEILSKCREAFTNKSTFYQAKVINYRGHTKDTEELYSEIVAKFLCENRHEYIDGIETVKRPMSYKTEGHDGRFNPKSNRTEEVTAMQMFNQTRGTGPFDFIGEIVDYQVPLKAHASDKAGKIDLISYDGNCLYILELKKKNSRETMLRCVLEVFTYMRTADIKKLLKDFNLPEVTQVMACPFVYIAGEQRAEMDDIISRPWLKELMGLLNSKPYYRGQKQI